MCFGSLTNVTKIRRSSRLLPPAKKQCAGGLIRLGEGYRAGSAGRAFAQWDADIGVWILRFRIAAQEFLEDLAEAVETSDHSKLLCWKASGDRCRCDARIKP